MAVDTLTQDNRTIVIGGKNGKLRINSNARLIEQVAITMPDDCTDAELSGISILLRVYEGTASYGSDSGYKQVVTRWIYIKDFPKGRGNKFKTVRSFRYTGRRLNRCATDFYDFLCEYSYLGGVMSTKGSIMRDVDASEFSSIVKTWATVIMDSNTNPLTLCAACLDNNPTIVNSADVFGYTVTLHNEDAGLNRCDGCDKLIHISDYPLPKVN